MRISQNWVQKYINFTFAPEELADRLTMLGIEVESIERLGEKYSGFVVGEVVDHQKHPRADRLSVCKVNVGDDVVQVVCGAPNVEAGQKVAVGLIGATIPKNQHDPNGNPFTLSAVKIRGVESHGMICSEFELDLGPDAGGILILPPDAKVGQSFARHRGLDDIVYEISITPNRPDLLSHIGIAREIGILVGRKPSLPRVNLRESNTPIAKHLQIRVEDKENCPRFAARMIRGITVKPSPAWLKQALEVAGLRPRNNIVDVTNYVMLEIGQPLHAFDCALLQQRKIIVRSTGEEIPFRTLDSKDRVLPVGTVMVCDGEREISIAGVMGGENSEISNATTDVVIEAAYWKPSSIRQTSKKLGISSDASYRFERGADPDVIPYALNRAAELMLQTGGGELLKGMIDVYPRKIKKGAVPIRPERTNALLGTALNSKQIVRYLNAIGVSVTAQSAKKLQCRIPSYRVDLEREIDLIEEIARVHGYDNIEDKTSANIDFSHQFEEGKLADTIRSTLIGRGYNEVLTNSMQDRECARLTTESPVSLKNPLNRDMAVMRSSLGQGLLQVAVHNQNSGSPNLRLFEIGHVFSHDATGSQKYVPQICEEERVSVLLAGEMERVALGVKSRPVDLLDMKGEVADILDCLSLDKWKFISYCNSKTLADNPIAIEINGSPAGYLGKVSGEVLSSFGLEQDVYVAELTLSLLNPTRERKYVQVPKYPVVHRDVALVVDLNVPAGELEDAIRNSGSELLSSVLLFDLYQGENLPPGKKSLAFALQLLSREKTLTDEEIEGEVAQIVAKMEQKFGAAMRTV